MLTPPDLTVGSAPDLLKHIVSGSNFVTIDGASLETAPVLLDLLEDVFSELDSFKVIKGSFDRVGLRAAGLLDDLTHICQ